MENVKEIWKPVVGYEGIYEVSNLGRIRKKTWKIVSGTTQRGGYRRINLEKDGEVKALLIHRLVAEAFILNDNNDPIINHIDENPSNNFVDNLEWCTYKHNSNCGTVRQRLSEHSANKSAVFSKDKINGDIAFYPSISDALKSLGKTGGGSSISEAASGKRKSAYGKYWTYAREVEDVYRDE